MSNNRSEISFVNLNRDAKSMLPHVMFQSFLVKKKNWNKKYSYPDWDLVFGNKDSIFLSRQDVLKTFLSDTSLGLVHSLVWGFPTGNKPGGANFKSFFDKLNSFALQIEKIQTTTLSERAFTSLNKVSGVKTSLTTKLLYFSGCKIDNTSCLIFDRRVLATLQLFNFVEFKYLNEGFLKLRTNPQNVSFQLYTAYCKTCSQIAVELNVTAETIEYLLFNQNAQIALAKASGIEPII